MELWPVMPSKQLAGNMSSREYPELIRRFRDLMAISGVTTGEPTAELPSWWPGGACSLGCGSDHFLHLISTVPLVQFGVRGVDVLFWVHRSWSGRWEL